MAITYNNVNSTANGAVGSSGYVYATSATGSAGQFLTSGSNGTSWANPATTFNSSNHKTIMTIPHGEDKIVLENSATFEVKGNVVINGIDLEERLKTIEKVLMIPERDAKMEAKYHR